MHSGGFTPNFNKYYTHSDEEMQVKNCFFYLPSGLLRLSARPPIWTQIASKAVESKIFDVPFPSHPKKGEKFVDII